MGCCFSQIFKHPPLLWTCSTAPLARNRGFRSDMGLAVIMLPAIACSQNTLFNYHLYFICYMTLDNKKTQLKFYEKMVHFSQLQNKCKIIVLFLS